MTTLTKLLPAQAAPAQALLDKAHPLPLTSAQRAELPQTIHTPTGDVTVGVAAADLRPLEVDDLFVDETGAFWAVRPAVEKVLHVTGDLNVLREAAGALINRGVRLAQIDEGFSVLPLPNLAKMLQMVGLEVTEAEEPFDPIQFREPAGGCGCGCGGHHHHHDEDECGCGHHHHHEEGECGCGGHHHHHGEGECCCGGHDHDHEECGCGGHHHHEEEECGCGCGGHHHHHGEGECCCGGHDHDHEECGCGGHHHHEEGECGCGGHHHHHDEGECCCGHDHDHEEKKGCCCGHDHEAKH
ncbi:hypothetical protein [uncultured Sutterella sp.]|uniref:hypothetical protein n=1 Tax=uncultured Sutterella sp. TaxID=286133 RepID=UPI00266FA331|nr:hypothetical protein [uncultured Sutterella sp.]